MSKLILYNGLKPDLQAITGIRTVFLWNNHLERENQEQPFLYPAIGIEFLPSNFRDKGRQATSQEYDMIVRLHILFESYEDEDVSILTITDNVWQVVQNKRYGTFGSLLRRNEEQNFDHPNVQDYIQDYATLGNDNQTQNLVDATLTPVLNPVELVKPNEL
jgi:hypothetical protein